MFYGKGRVPPPWATDCPVRFDTWLAYAQTSDNEPVRRVDVILAVNGEKVSSQTGFYRKLWSLGPAGVDVPLTVYHEGVTFDVVLASTDRARLLKAPRLH